MGFIQLPGSGTLGGKVEVNSAGWPQPTDWSSTDNSLIRCCITQIDQIWSQPLLVRFIRVANGVVDPWEMFLESKTVFLSSIIKLTFRTKSRQGYFPLLNIWFP